MREHNRGYRSALSISSGLVTLSLASVASAAFEGPKVMLDWFGSAGGEHKQYTLHEDSQHQGNGDGSWWFQGGDSHAAWGLDWEVTTADNGMAASNGSQFVNANLAVTNNSDEYQTFFALVTLVLPEQFVGGTLMNGSVSASVQDVFGGGAEIRSANGDPIYQAFIDDAPPAAAVHTLFDAPFSLVADPGGTNSTSTTFGIPDPIAGPEALTSISVLLRLELSPFDTANVVGTFEIAKLPAPSALPLLAGFGLALGSRRRRSS